MPTRNCDYCGTDYTRPPSLLGHYCSRLCAFEARRKPLDQLTSSYRMVNRPHHPLAGKTGVIPEHRLLLWDRIGPGPHSCHYCGIQVAWSPGKRTSIGALVVEHLDRDRRNNSATNLVPCCQRCNSLNRAYTVTDDERFVVSPDARRLRIEEAVCPVCSADFWRLAGMHKRSKPSEVCSRTCAAGLLKAA